MAKKNRLVPRTASDIDRQIGAFARRLEEQLGEESASPSNRWRIGKGSGIFSLRHLVRSEDPRKFF